MPSQIDRTSVERWLVSHGFVLRAGGKTSHRHFARDGIVVTLPGHGPQDLTKKHVGMIIRQLERAGFDRAEVRRALQG